MPDEKSLNLDPVTQEPGAHPVGTGLGAATGVAASGAAVGTLGGPVGAVIGGLEGAFAGGMGGRAVAESVNPTLEEAYWRENYNQAPYYESGRTFDDYGPAYLLGLSGQTSYGGNFEDVESRLEGEWQTQRASSSLGWVQARVASRAAWDRVAARSGSFGGVQGRAANTIQASSPGTVENDDVVDTLNDLLESCRDGEFGFDLAAEHAESTDIKTMLVGHAADCRTAGEELEALIRQLGGEPDEGGSVSGALHRGWVSVRGTLSGYSDQAMLDECERGEDSAVARYRKALKQTQPAAIRAVLERQAQGAQRNHDQVKAMRDALKAQG